MRTLCVTRDGNVYVGTEMGVSRYKEGAWERVFPPEGDPRIKSGAGSSTGSGQVLPWYVYDLMEASDGCLWAATYWGALRLGWPEATLYTTGDVAEASPTIAPYV